MALARLLRWLAVKSTAAAHLPEDPDAEAAAALGGWLADGMDTGLSDAEDEAGGLAEVPR